ncbi:TPA: hypothetical protein RG718_000419 [Providencia rettgeri]|nr:hypothetical protein [Providencia rettgeri]HEF8779550.1 hypothetical protein [Providencia rettgeri]
MSDVIDPKRYPEQAALQVVIEMIRAERIGMQSDGSRAIKIFDDMSAHFKALSGLPPDFKASGDAPL